MLQYRIFLAFTLLLTFSTIHFPGITAAQDFSHVDVRPGPEGSDPTGFTAFDGALYFSADDGTHGRELWRSDGTVAGTALVVDLAIGDASSTPQAFAVLDGALYFAADDGIHGNELWRTDGTPEGTVLVKDVRSGFRPSDPTGLTVFNGELYFAADDGSHGIELWKSDGTEEGTVLVKDLNEAVGGSYNSRPGAFTEWQGILYFSAQVGSGFTASLWKTDGTEEGTVLVKEVGTVDHNRIPQTFTEFGGELYFTGGGWLWKTDGTPGGTVQVTDMEVSVSSGWPVVLNDVLYFAADDGSSGMELWRTDGTSSGSVLVRDVYGGQEGSEPTLLATYRDELYFSARYLGVDPLYPATGWFDDEELWKSDGTASGTMLLKNISQRPLDPGAVGPITGYNGRIYFSAASAEDVALWSSDGSEAGTVRVVDAMRTVGVGSPYELTEFDGKLFFRGADSASADNSELWWLTAPPAAEALISVTALNGTAPVGETSTASLEFSSTGERGGVDLTYDITVVETTAEPAGPTARLTHSLNQVVETSGLACSVNSPTPESSYWRVFDLSEMDITGAFEIASVDVGIGASNGNLNTTVRLYTLDGPFTRANLTQIAEAPYQTRYDAPRLVNVPLAEPVTVSADDVLVVEWNVEAGAPTWERQIHNSVYYGANDAGETGPTFLSTAACGGNSEPGAVSDLGFDNLHWVLNVNGPLPVRISSTSGIIPAGGAEALTVTFDASTLEDGIYTYDLIVETSDPERPRTIIPVTFAVGDATASAVELPVPGEPVLTVYPNPTRGDLSLDLTMPSPADVLVEVFDVLGRRVMVGPEAHLAAGTHEIPIHTGSLPAGLYIVRASTPTGVATGTVVVVR